MARKILRNIFRFHGFKESLKTAGKGIVYLFWLHRNMRIIFMLGIAAFLAGLLFKLSAVELVALCVTITLVFMAEIFNTAIELMNNMFSDKYHPLVKIVKDISAAVVLIACLNAVAVGCILFLRRLFW